LTVSRIWVLTGGWGGAYKRGPFWRSRVVLMGIAGGLLIEIVEKREGMRGRRLTGVKLGGRPMFAQDANIWRP